MSFIIYKKLNQTNGKPIWYNTFLLRGYMNTLVGDSYITANIIFPVVLHFWPDYYWYANWKVIMNDRSRILLMVDLDVFVQTQNWHYVSPTIKRWAKSETIGQSSKFSILMWFDKYFRRKNICIRMIHLIIEIRLSCYDSCYTQDIISKYCKQLLLTYYLLNGSLITAKLLPHVVFLFVMQ